MHFHAELHLQHLHAFQHRVLLKLHLLLIQEVRVHEERKRRLNKRPGGCRCAPLDFRSSRSPI